MILIQETCLRILCTAIISLLLVLSILPLHAAETRGLTVVAKDTATNQTGEVKLYNKSYAVIIGIDEYPKLPADRQLSYAVNDAKGVEAALRKHFRFDRIVTLYNKEATRDRILELLTDELPAQMGEEDSLFVFWAGHGNQEKSRSGDIGYLIPHDGTPSKFSSNISMTQLKEDVSRKIPAKHVFYVMDACYGGLLAETRAVDKQSRRDLSYLKEITKEQVRQVLTAGSKGQEVLDGGPKGHSVFTGRLIEALEAAGDFITANEIQGVLKEKVYSDARARNHNQTPGYGTLYGSGDFVFVPAVQDKLGELLLKSAIRQQEFELLQKMEIESAAKLKEHNEIVKKQAELDALEKQIKEIKGKLSANSADNKGLIYTDPSTGLQWVRNGNISGKAMNWQEAKRWVSNLSYGGYNDWRLPTKDELSAFADNGGNDPAAYFNANGFNKVQANFYWSSTTVAGIDSFTWIVNMLDGVKNIYPEVNSYNVWPVRSASLTGNENNVPLVAYSSTVDKSNIASQGVDPHAGLKPLEFVKGSDHRGKVLQTLDAGSYAYVEVKEKGKKLWIAVMKEFFVKEGVKIGDTVEFPDAPPFVDFESAPLKKTFDKVIFIGSGFKKIKKTSSNSSNKANLSRADN